MSPIRKWYQHPSPSLICVDHNIMTIGNDTGMASEGLNFVKTGQLIQMPKWRGGGGRDTKSTLSHYLTGFLSKRKTD